MLHFLPHSERLLSGTLAAFLSDSATEMTVNNPPDVDRLPTLIELDPSSDTPETVRVTAVAGNVCTIERGVYTGGVGGEHEVNTAYKQKITTEHWEAIVNAIESGYLTEDPSLAIVRDSTTQFTITGEDHTGFYTKGRVLRINDGDAYCTVVSSTLSGSDTVVTVTGDNLPASITNIELAIQPQDMAALSAIYADEIIEKTAGAGVSIDGVLLKDGAVTLTDDINLDTDKNINVNGSDPWRTITITPGFLKPTTTSGCADSTKVEAGTNKIDYDVLDFDKDTQEKSFCNLQMPDSWDGGVIQFRFVWTASGGGSSQTLKMLLSGRSLANDDAIDQAMGTAVGVTDTWIADGDIHISAWSGDVTLAGSPAAGQFVHLLLARDVANDDLAVDGRIIGVQIRFKQKQYSD